MEQFYLAGVVLAAYLMGSLSFAVLVSRLMRLQDPRSYGSKNPGATNVLRSGHKMAAAATLLLDVLKGWLPMVFVQKFGVDYELGSGALAAVGFAAYMGHLYPVFFRFQGGKGVATALGVLLGVHWVLGLAVAVTWVVCAVATRYSSLAALVCAVAAPLYYLLGDREFWYLDKSMLAAIVMMGVWLIFRHQENIHRLIHGKETKLGRTSASKKRH